MKFSKLYTYGKDFKMIFDIAFFDVIVLIEKHSALGIRCWTHKTTIVDSVARDFIGQKNAIIRLIFRISSLFGKREKNN